MALILEDRNDLLALHRALLKMKFSLDPEDPDVREVAESPLIASTMHRIVDCLEEIDRLKEGEARVQSWRAWRDLEVRGFEFSLIKRFIKNSIHWHHWDELQKKRYVEILAAPFRVSDVAMSELVGLRKSPLTCDPQRRE